MVGKKSIGERMFSSFNTILMIIFMITCLYPFLYVLYASVSDPIRFTQHRGLLLKPLGFTMKGYVFVLKNPNIISGYLNTIFYVGVGSMVHVFFTSMSAYVMSRKNLFWGKPLMIMMTITMFFSGGLIPYYLLIQKLGLIDNRLVMIIPAAIGTWNLIILRTSFQGIPYGLEESARIDGANDFTIFFRVILPLSKAALAVIVLFSAVGFWNQWFNAMLYLRDRSKYPLQLILREILIENDTNAMTKVRTSADAMNQDFYKSLVKYCTIIVATVPILCVYPFLQKHFVKGVLIGSLKG